jgi:hypothetical protein
MASSSDNAALPNLTLASAARTCGAIAIDLGAEVHDINDTPSDESWLAGRVRLESVSGAHVMGQATE